MRTCAECGSSIEHKSTRAKYCNRTCKNRATQRRRPDERARNRDRYQKERARRQEYARSAYWNDPEHGRERSREYRKNNPHRRREFNDLRSERMRSNPGFVPFSHGEWERHKRLFGGECAYCHRPSEILEMDHVIPLSRGGRHALANIVPACPSCNRTKSSLLLVEWRARSMRGGDSPSLT